MRKNKKYIIKGLFLALALIILDSIWIRYGTDSLNYSAPSLWVAATFGIIVIALIKTPKLKHLFITLFAGVGALIFVVLIGILMLRFGLLPAKNYITYQADILFDLLSSGVLGSFFGATTAVILTALKLNLGTFKHLRESKQYFE